MPWVPPAIHYGYQHSDAFSESCIGLLKTATKPGGKVVLIFAFEDRTDSRSILFIALRFEIRFEYQNCGKIAPSVGWRDFLASLDIRIERSGTPPLFSEIVARMPAKPIINASCGHNDGLGNTYFSSTHCTRSSCSSYRMNLAWQHHNHRGKAAPTVCQQRSTSGHYENV